MSKGKAEGLSFGKALEIIEKGGKVARDNDFWESKGLFLSIKEIKEDNDSVIQLLNQGGTASYYTPVQSDILAKDWYDVENA